MRTARGRIPTRDGRWTRTAPASRQHILLADPAARYTDLGPDYVASRTDRDKKIRNHVRQLKALGLQVTLTPAA